MIKNPGRTCSVDRDCNSEISNQYFQCYCKKEKKVKIPVPLHLKTYGVVNNEMYVILP